MDVRTFNLLKNSIIYFIGNFSSKLLIFFLLPLYTHYLNPISYGRMDIYISILGMVYVIVSLQSIESVFRFMHDAKTEFEKGKVLTNSLFITICGLLFWGILVLIYDYITQSEYSLIFFLYVLTNILAQFYLQALRGLNNSLDYSISGILSTLLQLLCNIYFIVILNIGEISLLISPILANIGILIFLIRKCNLFIYSKKKYFSKEIIIEQLKYSLPLLPNALCLWAISSLGRYLILFYYGEREVGLFAFAIKFPLLLGVVNSIFFMAWQQTAILENNSKDKKKFYSRIFNFFVKIQLLVLTFILPLIKIIIFTIIGDSYIDAWVFIPIFFVAIIFNSYSNFYSMGFYSAKKTSSIFKCSVVSLVVYFFIGLITTKLWGVIGVGLAYALSQIVYYLIMKYKVSEYMKIDFIPSQIIKPLFLIFITTMFYYLGDIKIQFIIFLIMFLFTFIDNKVQLFNIVRILKLKIKGE